MKELHVGEWYKGTDGAVVLCKEYCDQKLTYWGEGFDNDGHWGRGIYMGNDGNGWTRLTADDEIQEEIKNVLL